MKTTLIQKAYLRHATLAQKADNSTEHQIKVQDAFEQLCLLETPVNSEIILQGTEIRCAQSCSPSDFSVNGKCNKHGCY